MSHNIRFINMQLERAHTQEETTESTKSNDRKRRNAVCYSDVTIIHRICMTRQDILCTGHRLPGFAIRDTEEH